MKLERVSVIGLGYIGLPTAAAFAARKKQVVGVDVNRSVVDTINNGEIHIVEPELDIVVHATVSEGYLRATTETEPADAFVIAVPTPFKEGYEPDLRYIEEASRSVAKVLKPGNLVVLESTSPVGATEQMAIWLAEERPDLTFPHQTGEDADIRIAHCPERVLPGHIMRELVENDRIIGGMTTRCSELAVSLYKIFVDGNCICTDVRTAEMAKLTENAFRDVNIAFANELSLICHDLGVDVWQLIALANRHPRVNILQPGAGVGGHCIAVDPWFIISQNPEQAKLIKAARAVNDNKTQWVVGKIKEKLADVLIANNTYSSEVSVCCMGLSFKPDIDDLRESPSVAIVRSLLASGIQVDVVEPHIESLPSDLKNAGANLISWDDAIQQSVAGSSILAFLVPHSGFIQADLPEKAAMLDFCGITQK